MANTGPDLINAIVGNQKLMLLKDCVSVPVQMGKAVYGSVQNDDGPDRLIEPGRNMQKQIDDAIVFRGTTSQTAVWHFEVTPVHHFAVVPWYRQDVPAGVVYTVFMAYENNYNLGDYVHGRGNIAPNPGGQGYKQQWTVSQLKTMFSDLLTSGTAWQDYFGNVGAAQATEIQYWKYKTTTLESAIANVNKY